MNKGEHRNSIGLQEIVNIRASINLGLSDKLKIAFPNTVPIKRPSISHGGILDPYWFAGFTSGEGCFSVHTRNSSVKLGVSVSLSFRLVQHFRDKELMEGGGGA